MTVPQITTPLSPVSEEDKPVPCSRTIDVDVALPNASVDIIEPKKGPASHSGEFSPTVSPRLASSFNSGVETLALGVTIESFQPPRKVDPVAVTPQMPTMCGNSPVFVADLSSDAKAIDQGPPSARLRRRANAHPPTLPLNFAAPQIPVEPECVPLPSLPEGSESLSSVPWSTPPSRWSRWGVALLALVGAIGCSLVFYWLA